MNFLFLCHRPTNSSSLASGVIRKASANDRARWMGDVKQLLESKKIAWTVWDYSSDSFGIVTPPGESDNGVIESLTTP